MNNIKKIRKTLELSQSDIAQIMNVKQNTISSWENDVTEPKVRDAIKLAEILRTTAEDLYK